MSAPAFPTVQGFCPVCGSESLFLGQGGYVTCGRIPCPEPDAVSTLLKDHETEHIVEFKAASFTVRHPLRERLRDELMDCQVHEHIAALSGPPVQPGRYRATVTDSGTLGWAAL